MRIYAYNTISIIRQNKTKGSKYKISYYMSIVNSGNTTCHGHATISLLTNGLKETCNEIISILLNDFGSLSGKLSKPLISSKPYSVNLLWIVHLQTPIIFVIVVQMNPSPQSSSSTSTGILRNGLPWFRPFSLSIVMESAVELRRALLQLLSQNSQKLFPFYPRCLQET